MRMFSVEEELLLMSARISSSSGEHVPVLKTVLGVALRAIGAVHWASVTVHRAGLFESLVVSDDVTRQIDAVQYEVRCGPAIDAILHERVYVSGDLGPDVLWPEYGQRVSAAGVRSVVSYPLTFLDEAPSVAAFNLYSPERDAFDIETVWAGMNLAANAALAVYLELSRERAQHLEIALHSGRDTGIAAGALSGSQWLTSDRASSLLGVASQHSNRSVVERAEEVLTGELSLLPQRRAPGRAADTGRASRRRSGDVGELAPLASFNAKQLAGT